MGYTCCRTNFHTITDALLSSLIDSNVNLKLKQRKNKELGAHSLARNTSGVEGRARASEWEREDGQAIHLFTQTCINQATSWLMHSWSTFSARMSHGQIRTHKLHHGPNLGEATTFPLIVYYVPQSCGSPNFGAP
jgi:hypothetical protein